MHQHVDGKIYMGQWYVGVIIYDPADGSFEIPEAPDRGVKRKITEHSHGYAIYHKSDTELYFTYSGGLYIYNTLEKSMNLVQKNQRRDENPLNFGIEFVDSRGMLHFQDGRKKLIARTLKEFDIMLSSYNFFRPHNSYLVNLEMVQKFIRSDGGYLILKNEMKIPVSKSKREDFLKLMG